jgi:hypothetical protein
MSFADTLLALAEFSLQYGLIGIDEYVERCEVALWLYDEGGTRPDPRGPSGPEDRERREPSSSETASESPQTGSAEKPYEPSPLEFLFQSWIFTKSDPDSYPSTPHGHFLHPERHWPKLNPYTGRVFKTKHQEDVSCRLNKKQMKTLWDDQRFRDFCRSYIMWYMETYPYHKFSVSNPLRFPRWR